jgi:phospholipid/cholesterol/gamma-HCH transport system substrate-binding protein
MKPDRTLEIGTGLFVALGFAALFFLTTQLPASGLHFAATTKGYRVEAHFDNVGDLKTGSPVSIAGVRIGRVESVRFDSTDFRAVVDMRIDPAYDKIPDDSDASIQTQGLLGGKYVGISPGGAETYLKDGSEIGFTQSAIVLETLVNKFFANFASKGGNSSSGSADSKDTATGGAAAAPAPTPSEKSSKEKAR